MVSLKPLALLLGLLPFLCGWSTMQVGDQIVTYYVNGTTGNDANTGLSTEEPWLTLGQAESVIGTVKNSGKRVILVVEEGTYREDLFDDSAAALLTGDAEIEFVGVGDVIVKGSDLTDPGDWSLEGGLACGGTSDCYSHAWTNDWGVSANPYIGHITDDIVLRREMVFVDGTLFRQYLLQADMEANQNSFWVDDDPVTGKIYVHFPGTDPGDYTSPGIELAERSYAFQSRSGKNIDIRGLTVQHFATPINNNAIQMTDVNNILVEDCELSWNNDGGFGAGAYAGPACPDVTTISNVTLRQVTNNNNGLHAMGMNSCDTCTLDTVESSYNNWRGHWGEYHSWSVSNKYLRMRDFTITDYTAIDNYATGLWLDSDNQNVAIDGCLIDGNGDPTPANGDSAFGLFLESNQGPITVNDCIIRNSQQGGIVLANSQDVTITNSQIYDNNVDTTQWQGDYTQMVAAGVNDPGQSVCDRDTGSSANITTDNLTMTGNVIYGDSDYLFVHFLNAASWNNVLSTLTSDYNDWRNDDLNVFSGNDQVQMVFGPSQGTPNWQTDTGQDANSTWTTLP